MLTYDLSDTGSESLYEHLYRCIRADIESGAIAPGEHLPSKRTFAKQLGVSLITVENAYTQLIAEGYVRTMPRRGYYACELPFVASKMGQGTAKRTAATHGATVQLQSKDPSASQEGHGGISGSKPPASRPDRARGGNTQRGQHLQTAARVQGAAKARTARKLDKLPATVADFSKGGVPYDEAAVRMWARSMRSVLNENDFGSALTVPHPEGLPRLRESIARHLHGFRGMDVDPDRIVIGAGAQSLYLLIVQLLGRENGYAIEDPGYRQLAHIYRANGAGCKPVSMDAEGIDVAALDRSGASVAHIMPSHQFPCGTVTSIGRRYQLLAWASESPERFIIEDDYDSEFRLAGRPIPSLSSIDAVGKVIYVNTFSKSLGPALRVAYLVLPTALMQRFRQQLGFYAGTVSALDQIALAQLIDSGDYERHVNRYRTRHRAHRDALVGAFRSAAAEHASWAGEASAREALQFEQADSGLHFVLAGPVCGSPGEAAERERAIAARAAEKGVRLAPLSTYALEERNYEAFQKTAPNGIRARFAMQYTDVPEGAFKDAARIVVEAMNAV